MKSLWNNEDPRSASADLLTLRTYTSNLIGQSEDLVLHGGGNTSVKINERNFFGETEDLLYVKGSGWDLATIKPEGFAPVKLQVLRRLATLTSLADADMVREQKAAMTNPQAPNPSIEAILHAVIPFRFVDHTHADAVVTVTNCVRDTKKLAAIFGERVMLVPYVMPGFVLARQVFELTQDVDWEKIDAIVLMHHGIFTFADAAKDSYERMISYVTKAEDYLQAQGALAGKSPTVAPPDRADYLEVARVRQRASQLAGRALLARWHRSSEAVGFSENRNVSRMAVQGPLTPDHVIHTKPKPMVIQGSGVESVERYAQEYQKYFSAHRTPGLTALDCAPRWAVWPGRGVLTLGSTQAALSIVSDIVAHTTRAMQWGEGLGGWWGLPEKDLFAIEYWELEQAKLKKGGNRAEFEGQVALVTGAASGIGKACVTDLLSRGAQVIGFDINPAVKEMNSSSSYLGMVGDATSPEQLLASVQLGVQQFGGLDIVVSNAGTFPSGSPIAEMAEATWQHSLDLNLTSHERLLQVVIPFLQVGWKSAVVFVGSKNVPAPGPGAAAYSVAKAGLTQLARVAALELGASGIRVNVVHPNAVFDTGIWTEDVLASRAKSYGMSVDEYKRNNVLKTEVTSMDVARLVSTLAGPAFAKTTGAQVPIDGGNDRVI